MSHRPRTPPFPRWLRRGPRSACRRSRGSSGSPGSTRRSNVARMSYRPRTPPSPRQRRQRLQPECRRSRGCSLALTARRTGKHQDGDDRAGRRAKARPPCLSNLTPSQFHWFAEHCHSSVDSRTLTAPSARLGLAGRSTHCIWHGCRIHAWYFRETSRSSSLSPDGGLAYRATTQGPDAKFSQDFRWPTNIHPCPSGVSLARCSLSLCRESHQRSRWRACAAP